MIFVRDKGRMCNNILQFAHVWAWAKEHERRAISMRFAYKYPYFSISSSSGHNFLTYFFAKSAASLHLLPVVSFNTPRDVNPEAYDALVARMACCRNLLVEGWEVRFYDLFLKYRREITAMFAFRPEVEKAVDSFFGNVAPSAITVGVHIRRGDYARWNGGRYFFDDSQMACACKRVAESIPGGQVAFCICGNDPNLNRSPYHKLAEENPRLSFHFAAGNPGEDLCMLSRCNRILGPPSTFSLVAAMYRDTPLYWISDPEAASDFKPFATLFREIK
ncbi:MAG: hypothetical protein NC097_01355 [Clostridium sp.]|nr:glycosyltransferase [Prevotella sp.]MCM1428428.1 hypothetical protein [Clostridium sp.]